MIYCQKSTLVVKNGKLNIKIMPKKLHFGSNNYTSVFISFESGFE